MGRGGSRGCLRIPTDTCTVFMCKRSNPTLKKEHRRAWGMNRWIRCRQHEIGMFSGRTGATPPPEEVAGRPPPKRSSLEISPWSYVASSSSGPYLEINTKQQRHPAVVAYDAQWPGRKAVSRRQPSYQHKHQTDGRNGGLEEIAPLAVSVLAGRCFRSAAIKIN